MLLTRRSQSSVAAIATMCLVAAACGGGAKASVAPTTGRAASSGGTTATGTRSQGVEPSATPFEIGLLNDDTGANSYPGVDNGALTAARWLNATKGGVGGHPIEILTCEAGVDAASEQACGQHFADDPGVKVVISGFLFAGGGAYSALDAAGKSVIGGEPIVASDLSAKNVFFYRGGTTVLIAGISDFAINQLHAKSGALIVPNDSAGQAETQVANPLWAAANLPLKVATVVGNEPDLAGALNAAGASSADVILPALSSPGCVQAARAISALRLDKPVVATALCLDPSVLAVVRSQMQGWYYVLDQDSNDPRTGVSPDIQTMRDAWRTYGTGDVAQTAATTGFANVVIAAQVANRLGGFAAATAPALDSALSSFSGPVFAGPSTVKCPGRILPSVCATQYTVEQLKGGDITLVNGGRFATAGS